jgi:hypothetical protein
MPIGRTLAVAALLLAAGPLFGQVGPFGLQDAKLTGSDATTGHFFGSSVSVAEDTAVVGARVSNAAYVFVRTASGWSQQAKLTPPDGAPGDQFGIAVSVSGDTALIGASVADTTGALAAGAVYVFVRTGTVWSQQAKLQAADGSAGDSFGGAVSLSGSVAVVGAGQADLPGNPDAGAAYVFVRHGTTWVQQAKLVAGEATDGAFGYSVAVSDDTAVVSALTGDGAGGQDTGAAYVFLRTGTVWSQQSKLSAGDGLRGEEFGTSVALSGDTVVVGAQYPLMQAGAAYVFVRTGIVWNQQAKLMANDGAQDDHFGVSVSVSGDTAIVGAHEVDAPSAPDSGAAYVFTRTETSWVQRSKLTPADGAQGDRFGNAVSVSGERAVIGAIHDDTAGGTNAGSAYAFSLVPLGTWSSLGVGMSGTAGVPTLVGEGTLLAGLPVSLMLASGKPFSLAPLVVGLSNLSAPFKGGVMVPNPNFIFPLFTDFFGHATFGGLWPAGVPSGFTTYFQWWIQDPAGPQGYAASNGLAGTAP